MVSRPHPSELPGAGCSLSVIVPTYNEADNVRPLVGRLESALAGLEYEIIFVDDSADGTTAQLSALSRSVPRIRVIHREGRRGLASAVVAGIAAARNDIICVLDADLQHPPELVTPLVNALLETGADLAVASRYIPGGRYDTLSAIRGLASRTAIRLAHLLLPRARSLSDPVSGFFAFRRAVVAGVRLTPLGYKILLEILVRGRVGGVTEIPYEFRLRAGGRSKLTVIQQWEYLRHLWRLVRSSAGTSSWTSAGVVSESAVAASRRQWAAFETCLRLSERCLREAEEWLGYAMERARAAREAMTGGQAQRVFHLSMEAGADDSQALGIRAADRRRVFVRHLKDGFPARVGVFGHNGATPRVSVIIPSANPSRSEQLQPLVDGLQTSFPACEVIVVQGDRRQGRAINTGAAIARGDVLVTMDDDTRLGDPEILRKLLDVLDRDPSIGIAGVPNLVPPDAPPIVQRAMQEIPRRSSPPVRQVTDSDLAEHCCLATRRDLFLRIGGEHELIPRGLDPYLRREVRRLGYRVVVIPDTWVHHPLPPSVPAIIRQYFRNGAGAAYVRKFHPDLIIDQALDHGQRVSSHTTLPGRVGRYAQRLVQAVISKRWIYLATLLAYAGGYIWGLATLQEDSL